MWLLEHGGLHRLSQWQGNTNYTQHPNDEAMRGGNNVTGPDM